MDLVNIIASLNDVQMIAARLAASANLLVRLHMV